MNLQGPVGGTSSEGGCCRGRAVKSIQQMILKKGKLQLIFISVNFCFSFVLACMAGVRKGREGRFRRERDVRGLQVGRDRNTCHETTVFLVFNIHQAKVKILIGQSSKHVNHSLNTLI